MKIKNIQIAPPGGFYTVECTKLEVLRTDCWVLFIEYDDKSYRTKGFLSYFEAITYLTNNFIARDIDEEE